jgi:uncharacterized RDD family membrane protein YckC
LDDALDARVRRVLHRKPAAPGLPGVAVRGVALVLDAAIALVAFGLAAGSITLIASLAGLGAGSVGAVAAGAGWLLTVAVYFGGFWATTGQTPGMRMARIRVVAADGAPPGPLRALVRVAGLLLSIGMLFVGFAPALVDTRRRALPDFLAGTVVVDQDDALAANHPHGVMSREASPGMVSQ